MKTHSDRNRLSMTLIYRAILLVFISHLMLLSHLWAQTVHNERILAPEVSHFARPAEPGVDAHGDLSLSIPLMTVPGRDGLNFDIVAQYRSGIQVKQSASWIGLGWSLDVGSITRHPLGSLSEQPQADWAKATSGQITSQPDVYMVTMNGASSILTSTTMANPFLPFDPHASDSTQKYFVPSPWRPWKINYSTATPVSQDGFSTGTSDNDGSSWSGDTTDVSKFIITVEDGARYIYDLPTLSDAYFPDEAGQGFLHFRFVSTWRLRAILSPNYSGPEIPDTTSTGGWIRISYRTWDEALQPNQENGTNWKTTDTILQDDPGTAQRILAQLTYPWKVETPTHYAEFTTSRRYDRDLAKIASGSSTCDSTEYPDYNRKLDKITLYKSSGVAVSDVSFTYMDNGAPVDVPDGSAKLDSMLSKLTLKKITMTGIGGGASVLLPSYKFAYYNDTTLSWQDVACNLNPLLKDYQDNFGYFWHDPAHPDTSTFDDRDGRMWSLKEITYPEGRRLLIEYENDWLSALIQSYSRYTYQTNTYEGNVTATFKRFRQGGARVTFLTKYDGYGSNGETIAFSYGAGHHSGIPETWFLNSGGIGAPLSYSGERGQFNVTYNMVQKTFSDGSSIKIYHKTDNGAEPQMLYRRGTGGQTAILNGNTRWNWGEIDRIEYHAPGAGNTEVKEELFYTKFLGLVYDEDSVAVVAPPLLYGTSSYTPPIYLNFTYKQLDSVVTKHYFGSQVVTSREVNVYDNNSAQLKSNTETSGDGKVRKTEYGYAHDWSGSVYAAMKTKNMRSQIGQVSIKDNNDKGYSSTITTWKAVTYGSNTMYLPAAEYEWRKDQTGLLADLLFTGGTPDESEGWILTQTFDQYDQHGNPKRIIGAYGGADSTTIRWDLSGVLIDSIKTRPNATTTLTTKYGYDTNTFRLTSIFDPNNQKTEYKYDPLQRLIETINPDKRTAATQSYSYSRQTAGSNDNFVTTNPNFVRSVLSSHADHVRNHDFETGSGSVPDYWTWNTFGTGCMAAWDNTISFSGAKSIKADIPTQGPNNRVRWMVNPWYDEKVSSKETYRMEVWVKTANNYNGNAKFILFFHNSDHTVVTETPTITIPAGDSDWKKYTWDFNPLPNTDHLYAVYLDFVSSNQYRGTIWYDRANFYELNISKTFADGLGRDIETLQFEGNTLSTQAATYYDFAGRVSKVTKPFLSADTSFTITLSGSSTIAIDSASQWYASKHRAYNSPDEYDISYPSNADAFSATDYWADPLNRVKYQYFPGTAFSKPSTDPNKKYIKNFYTTNQENELGFAANKVLETRILDENGVLTEIFTDTFGNQVGVRVDSAAASADSTKLATLFQYDILNNLTKIVPPKAFQNNGNTPSLTSPLCTDMAYSTLSQLMWSKAPDADTVRYLYDKKGNLRFVKDGKGKNGSYFIYYKYDNLSRKIEEVTVSGLTTFRQDSADTRTFPTSTTHTLKVKYQYDVTTGYNIVANNLKGRLYVIEYISDRYPNVKGWVFHSYDANGNVEWIEQYIPKANIADGNSYLVAKIEYKYDALGNVTKMYFHRTFPPGASSDAFYVWYDYDNLGRLERVYTNTTDVKPTTSFNAQYTYWPSGQVKRLLLGNTVQGIDYLYSSRDWLTQINHHSLLANKDPGNDSTTVTKDRFGEIIGYNKQKYIASDGDYTGDFDDQFNGNISWMTSNTSGMVSPPGASLNGWVFKYDKANRLSKGNWGYNTSPTATNWSASNNYDLTGIKYDRNGNLDYMTRYNEYSEETNMDYFYTNGTNKLHKIPHLPTEDSQYDNNYVYDANGNLIKDIVKLGSGSTITYDYRNLPIQVPKSVAPAGTLYFGYDGNGQRVSKNNLFYIPDAQGRVIAAYNIDGTHLYWNVWGLDLIGQRYWKP